MSLREELQAIVRLQLTETKLGDEAVQASLEADRAWGTDREIQAMLLSYCTGLENALLRLADEVEDLQFGSGEAEA